MNESATGSESSNGAKSLRFPTECRLRHKSDFARIYGERCRASDRRLLLFVSPNSVGITRIGFSISRKHGNSVARHRLRRRIKEGFRLNRHQLPAGWDIIAIPGPDLAECDFLELQQSLVRLVHQGVRKSQRRGSPEKSIDAPRDEL